MFRYFILLVLAALCALQECRGAIINPSRILMTTVIDVSNDEIVRDALTLFRSIRLFGDSFNNATFLAYITMDDTFVDTTHLLANLSSLRIQWDFIKPVESYVPKTMNKILTFHKFDSLKYDYLLWLDADVVLFRDPIPYLLAHQFPGQIQCAPDVYNYLKRFPNVNGSNIVWNTAMSEYQLDGHNEFAPHGLCNTGVLLFDKLSLATFMGALNETMAAIRPVNPYQKDRFLDSLVFVAIVNRYNIDVMVRGYELNYMSFFEIEIQESSTPGDLIFAHLITHTDLYCYMDATKGCLCLYHNDNLGEVSLIFNEMAKFSNVHVCSVLAGGLTMGEYEALGYPTSISYADTHNTPLEPPAVEVETLDGAARQTALVQWPPQDGRVFHDLADARVPVQIKRSCSAEPKGLPVTIMLELRQLGTLDPLCVHRKLLGPCRDETLLETLICSVQKAGNMDGNVDNSYYRVGETPVEMRIMLSGEGWKEAPAVHAVSFTLVQNSLAYPGLARFSDNLLLGRRPIQLDSQLNFVPYLEMWGHGKGKQGVVICCETPSGVAVVEDLINRWSGEILVVHMRKIPEVRPNCPAASPAPATIQDWSEYFSNLCESAGNGLRCAIFDVSSSGSRDDSYRHGMYLFQRYDMSFVYMDVYEGYGEYRDSIVEWLDILPKGGILIGSRYTSWGTSECVSTRTQRDTPEPCVDGPRAAVDAAGFISRRAVLATYAEESSGSAWSGANKYCRALRRISAGGASCAELEMAAHQSEQNHDCALDAVWSHDSDHLRHAAIIPLKSECFFRPIESDCAPAWFFQVVSKPLSL